MFVLSNIVFDRFPMAIAEKVDGSELLYAMNQISDASIELGSDPKEARDAQGNLVKRFYQGKTAGLSLTNVMLDFNIIGAQSGNGVEIVTTDNTKVMPKILLVEKSAGTVDITGFVEGTVRVHEAVAGGNLGKAYAKDTTAAADKYSIASNTLTLPTDTNATSFIVKYDRTVDDGFMITNSADKFPNTVKLTLKGLGSPVCEPDVLKAYYVVFPSFQVSPDTTISLTTDATFDYSGEAQIAYCAASKDLYYICSADDDAE